MAANKSSGQIFSAITYKALDYVFETTTSLKVTMNFLALPMPYHPGDSDHYPDLPEAAYRTPWIRGRVVSTCKLFVSGSVLEDLGGMEQPIDSLERFSVNVSQMNGAAVDVVPSSNPNSQVDLDGDEAFCLLHGSKSNVLYQESFCKSTVDQMCPRNQNNDLLLPEEVMLVDHLPQFKRHLPTLKAKLSRLRNLPVSDPLLSSTGDTLSEDTIFRHCASYEPPPDVNTKDSQTCSAIHEEFGKEALTNEESLLLPVELDTSTLDREKGPRFQSIRHLMNAVPEPLPEQLPALDELRKATQTVALSAADISQFDVPEGFTTNCKMNAGLIDPQSEGHSLLEMELDLPLTLTPKASLTQLRLSTSQFHVEQMSPACRPYFVSERDQETMELALWKAEKHPAFMLRFMFAEPQIYEPAVDFQHLSEAKRVLKMNEEHFVSVLDSGSDKLQSQMWTGAAEVYLSNSCEFTERMNSERPCGKEDEVEDFTTLSPDCIEHILRVYEEDRAPPVLVSGVRVRPILKNPLNPAQPSHLEVSGNTAFETSTCAAQLKEEAASNTLQMSFLAHADITNTNEEEPKTPVCSAAAVTANTEKHSNGQTFCAVTTTTTLKAILRPFSRDESRPEQGSSHPKKAISLRLNGKGKHRSRLVDRHLPEKDLDPLSTFMMLRSQQRAADPVLPESTDPPVLKVKQTPQPPPQPTPEQRAGLDRRPTHTSGVVTGNASRAREPANQPASHTVSQPITQDKQGSKVVQVQATESQWCACWELLVFAQPCLSRARELGLNSPVWGDFSSLAPDQTRFLLKQQEKELCGMQGHDKELLFNQVALIHVLVTVKDLLLKCDLNTAVEYLVQAAEACSGQRLEQLVRRLQVLLYLSYRNQEPNPKILELQDQLVTWLRGRKDQNPLDKALVIITVDSDNVRTMLIKGLGQLTSEAVTSARPEEGQTKLNGARLLNSMPDSVFVVVCGQHVGADFPWECFSLVVEYERSGNSPWAAICRERDICHLIFNTILPNTEGQTACWSLEENVPHVLLVTDGLVNCPLLLQILESTYNMTVLERSYSASLQMLGGTQHYAVITVDQSTAVVIQEQEGLCQDRACEAVMMRLTVLSLQYSCCWLVLHCPQGQGGGLSSEAFNNLVLIYSSLMLFSMKSDDLDVKVVIVSEVVDVARWISQICFHSLMASDRDPLSYLDRDWLAVIPSEEEKCLLLFPCVNPLVSQLMLRRAPSLQWLLGASLSQLEELLPDVPHKVLKLFSETTSQYKLTTDPSPPDSHTPFTQRKPSPPSSPWTTGRDRQSFSTSPATSFLSSSFRERDPGTALQDDDAYFQVDRICSFGGSDSDFQSSWTNSDPWKEEEEEWGGLKFAGRSVRGKPAGRVVERRGEEWKQRATVNRDPLAEYLHAVDDNPFRWESSFSYGVDLRQPACSSANSQTFSCPATYNDLGRPDDLYRASGLSSPAGGVPQGGGGGGTGSSCHGGGTATISPSYGSKCWIGRERKRTGEVAGMVGTGALREHEKTGLSGHTHWTATAVDANDPGKIDSSTDPSAKFYHTHSPPACPHHDQEGFHQHEGALAPTQRQHRLRRAPQAHPHPPSGEEAQQERDPAPGHALHQLPGAAPGEPDRPAGLPLPGGPAHLPQG